MEERLSKKIQRISFLLKWMTFALMLILPLINAGYWMLDGFPSLSFFQIDLVPHLHEAHILPMNELPGSIKFLAFLVTLIPIGFFVMALNFLRILFSAFERLEIFSNASLSAFRYFGWTLFVSQLIYPIYLGLITFVLTLPNPPGQRILIVAFGLPQFFILTISLSILLISYIMQAGQEIKR